VLAGEEGRFTLADVARGVHDKLVARHPHVFGDVVAETPEDVAANWEVLKKNEKGRASVTEGIPGALPALALAAALQRKAETVGLELPDLETRRGQVVDGVGGLEPSGTPEALGEAVGDLLFSLADVARRLGVDPETALRARAGRFRDQVEARESRSPP
jgi:uncharacterized protein YabN with tetrapyrrole methylase and pyrophosphatase domain